MLDNKIIFYSIIRNFTNASKIYAYKMKGKFILFESGFERENLFLRLHDIKQLVYKKVNFGGGDGFKLIQYQDGIYYVNREKSDKKEIQELFESEEDYLIEEFVEQSKFENEIFPYSVNTIRIITAENQNGEYEVLGAIQRIGMDQNKCIDNVCAGGLYSKIDLKTGRLSSARSKARDLYRNDSRKINGIFYSPNN